MLPCWNRSVALLPTILTEWVISSGWVTTIVVFAGKSIVSYSGLCDIRSPRSWASVVGAGGSSLRIERLGQRAQVPVAPMNGVT